MYVQNFRSVAQNCGRYVPDIHTYIHGKYTIHTDRQVKQEKPGANQNTSPGSVLVSIQYRLEIQYDLVTSTGSQTSELENKLTNLFQ